MTTMSIPVVGYSAHDVRQLPALRRLVLVTGLTLVSWGRRAQRPLSHDEQARIVQTDRSRRAAAGAFRYGIAQ